MLDAVVGSLLGHKAHGVFTTGGGELAHGGPLVSLRIIEQHIRTSCCNDGSLYGL